jgi:hypothetical protein
MPSALPALSPLKALGSGFEQNRGQFPDTVAFRARSADSTLTFLGDNVVATRAVGSTHDVLTMSLVGSLPTYATPIGAPLPGDTNEYYGSDAARWVTGIRHFRAIEYHYAYPGTDWVFHETAQGIEYAFTLAPDADAARIAISFAGATPTLDSDGALHLATPDGEIIHQAPACSSDAVSLPCEFTLDAAGVVGFHLDHRPPGRPVLIDPLIFSTFIGAGEGVYITDIKPDSKGGAIVAGYSDSPDLPTQNAYQSSNHYTDEFIMRLDSNGDLVYSTFLGGTNQDIATALAVDPSDSAAVVGYSYSTDFPQLNLDPSLAPPSSAPPNYHDTLAKLDSQGRLVLGGRIGGSSYDYPYQIAVDASSGNMVFAGYTSSTDFPTRYALQATDPAPSGNSAGTLTSVSASGSVVYSTYLGQSTPQFIRSDGSGGIVEVGSAYQAGYPVRNAIQGSPLTTNAPTTVITHLASDGTAIYSTYLGGSGSTWPAAVAIDASGYLTVVGQTQAYDYPRTFGAPQSTFSGPGSAFVSRITPTGALDYSTFLGNGSYGCCGGGGYLPSPTGVAYDSNGNTILVGQLQASYVPTMHSFQTNGYMGGCCSGGGGFVVKLDRQTGLLDYGSEFYGAPYGVAVDAEGRAVVTGITTGNLPSAGPLSSFGGGYTDGFVLRVDPDGTLGFSTYLGGSSDDTPRLVGLDPAGHALLAGSTSSTDFPRVNALPPNYYRSTGFAFVSKLDFDGTGSAQVVPPTGLYAVLGADGTSVTLHWRPGTGGMESPTSYRIYRSSATSLLQFVGTAPGADPSFTDAGLASGTYTYRVTAVSPTTESSYSDPTSVTVGFAGSVESPRGVTATPTSGTDAVALSWSQPATSGVTSYNVYHMGALGDRYVVATTTDTSYVAHWFPTGSGDVHQPCGNGQGFAISAVTANGEGPPSAPATFAPDAATQLICSLHDQNAFYWGEPDLDNPPAPDATPTSFAQVAAHVRQGQVPVYYQTNPSRITCCVGIAFDDNRLQAHAKDVSSIKDQITAGMPFTARYFVQNLLDKISSAQLDDSGLKFEGDPHPDANGALSLDAVETLEGSVGPLTGSGLVAGSVHADPTTGIVQTSGLDTIQASAQWPGPSFGAEGLLSNLPAFEGIPFLSPPDVSINTHMTASLGGRADPSPFRMRVLSQGIGAGADASLGFHEDAYLVGVDGSGSASAGIKVEAVEPISGQPESFRSGYTGIQYEGLRDTAITLRTEPIRVSYHFEACFMQYHCNGPYDNTVPFGQYGFTFADSRFHSDSMGIIVGSGASTQAMTSRGAASPTAPHDAVVPASVQQVPFQLVGAPGSVGSLTIERPIGYYLPNGTYTVAEWNVTIPGIHIGDQGTSNLFVDTAAVERQVQSATREAGMSFNDAVGLANVQLDLNGDGQSDLLLGVPPPTTAPTVLTLDPIESLEIGDTTQVSATLTDPPGTPLSEGATIEFHVGAAGCAATSDAAGRATCSLAVGPSTIPGIGTLYATFAGDASNGASADHATTKLIENAPIPTIDNIPLYAKAPLIANTTLPINISVGSRTDVQPTATIQIDGLPALSSQTLQPLIDVSPSGLNLTEGFHHISVQVTDRAGHIGVTNSTFVIDRQSPTVTTSARALAAANSTYSLAWSASEPVLGILTLTGLDGTNITIDPAIDFATNGTITAQDLPPGAYQLHLVFRDTANNTWANSGLSLILVYPAQAASAGMVYTSPAKPQPGVPVMVNSTVLSLTAGPQGIAGGVWATRGRNPDS